MADDRHQRLDAKSNAHAGREFEQKVKCYLENCFGWTLNTQESVDVGVGREKKAHRFDLVSHDPQVLVECKSHRWTKSGNVPHAKIRTLNEAVYLFHVAPKGNRKMLFLLKHMSERHGSYGSYYVEKYKHLIPTDVEVWELDELTNEGTV